MATSKSRSTKQRGSSVRASKAGGQATSRKSAKSGTSAAKLREQLAEYEGQLTAISKSQAVIEFELDGTIVTANDNFCQAVGYTLDEIQGQHHRIFVDATYANSPEYRQFWSDLGRGQFSSGEFERFRKDGQPIWIQATYNPVFNSEGEPYKVVKYASDITKAKMAEAEMARVTSMMEQAPSNIMFADTEFIVQYMNPESLNTLKSIEEHLPVRPEEIVGQSIDIFHKNPSHQRKILSNPDNLPIRSQIQVGPETLDLLVSPVRDQDQNYLGAMVTWEVITEKLRIETEMARVMSMMEQAPSNIMFADTEFIVQYMNPESLNTLKSIEEHLPVRPEEIVGQSIDIFHKNPSHQRKILSNPNNLPIRSQIQVGPETLDLLVSPVRDQDQNYLGAMVTWEVITAKLRTETEMARVMSMMEQAPSNIMFADTECMVQYMNPASLKTLQTIEEHLPIRPEEIVGQCIDIFHKNPSHQRRILADPNNLPIQSQIQVGPETLDLLVSPVRDQDQKYLGAMVTWEVITQKLAMENQIKENQEREAEQAELARSQVEQILGVLQRVSKGDYSEEITVSGDDAIGNLADGLRTFFAEKQATERQIAEKSEHDRLQAEETQRKVDMVLSLVNGVADGRFDLQVPDLGTDPVGQVATALEKAMASVRSTLVEVRDVSSTVATASTQMSSAAEEISRGAQQQAARLEETAASLEEITTTVKQNSDNAQEARSLANGSRDVATEGGNVVSDAVQAMSEINDSSKQIAAIITTIDEIAFQTNLLALNAAVEAARAGEQGRGFAVVASEVRNLAQRSASSAKEIKTLIQDSNSKVEKGTELVNKSGETLGEIVDSVKRVTDIVAEIAAASQEQLTGIEQVTKAVTQMDQVTQANASQTEELAGTSGSVLNHARRLDQVVSKFQLGEGGGVPHAAPAAPSTPTHAPVAPTPSSEADEFMEF